MTRRPALPLLLAASLLPTAGWAQSQGDKVRLDDFALPQSAPAPVQQIAPDRESLPEAPAPDRSLAVPAPPAQPRGTVSQLSSEGEGAPAPAQLAPAGRSAAASAPLSATADSRPEGTVVLGGKDRCDPQTRDSRELARCRRILELRAAEFQAAEAPVLSAEQKILAAQQARERNVPLTAESGLRMTRTGPDPEDRSDQELAAVVLGTAPPPLDRAQDPAPAPEPGDLADILEALGAGTPTLPN